MVVWKRVHKEIPGVTVTDEKALREWMDSGEHDHRCNAWSEGQCCCLDMLIGDWVE